MSQCFRAEYEDGEALRQRKGRKAAPKLADEELAAWRVPSADWQSAIQQTGLSAVQLGQGLLDEFPIVAEASKELQEKTRAKWKDIL